MTSKPISKNSQVITLARRVEEIEKGLGLLSDTVDKLVESRDLQTQTLSSLIQSQENMAIGLEKINRGTNEMNQLVKALLDNKNMDMHSSVKFRRSAK